jgi:hypothetical protein
MTLEEYAKECDVDVERIRLGAGIVVRRFYEHERRAVLEAKVELQKEITELCCGTAAESIMKMKLADYMHELKELEEK